MFTPSEKLTFINAKDSALSKVMVNMLCLDLVNYLEPNSLLNHR